LTAGHSLSTIENAAVSRRAPSKATRAARRIPSNWAPSRRIALRERMFRASVMRLTRCTRHPSKACVSISSLASVLMAVRCAAGASQVAPISTTSGRSWPRWNALPAGHDQNSTLR
jgi:hypothetical protein